MFMHYIYNILPDNFKKILIMTESSNLLIIDDTTNERIRPIIP